MYMDNLKPIRIVVWGTGNIAGHFLRSFNRNCFELLFLVDNNANMHEREIAGWKVFPPDILRDNSDIFDLLIICAGGWRKIYRQALSMHIPAEKLENGYMLHKMEMILYYEQKYNFLEDQKRQVIDYLRLNPLDALNYDFTKKYHEEDVDVFYDHGNNLYYVNFSGKRMYLNRRFKNKEQVQVYCNQLLMEQDPESPHCYLTDDFTIELHDVVLDAGAAEGNFALSIVEKADQVYLIESDELWIEALNYTFEPYRDKVVLINKFLSDNAEGNNITIDKIAQDKRVDFIKMDIEGAEAKALKGAKHVLTDQNPKLDICAYHSGTDEESIRCLAEECGYNTHASSGYLVYIHGDNMADIQTPKLVKGLIRAKKYW